MSGEPSPRTCPSCGASDSFQYVSQIFSSACTCCGHYSDEVQFYQPGHHVDDNYDQPAVPVGAAMLGGGGASNGYATIHHHDVAPLSSSDMFLRLGNGAPRLDRGLTRLEKQQLNARRHRPQIARLIQGTLNRLGQPHFAARANALFDQAKAAAQRRNDAAQSLGAASAAPSSSAHQTPSPDHDANQDPTLAAIDPVPSRQSEVRWGSTSENMAAACCYAVLRQERKIVDLRTVADAAVQPYHLVHRSLRSLKVLAGETLRDVSYHHVDAIIVRIVDFFEQEMRRDGGAALDPIVRQLLDPLVVDQARATVSPRLSPPAAANALTKKSPFKGLALKKSPSKASPYKPVQAVPKPSFAKAKQLALDLGYLWWPQRNVKVSPTHAAFAITTLAFEAVARRTTVLRRMVRHADAAVQGPRPDFHPQAAEIDGANMADDAPHLGAILPRYHEVMAMLNGWVGQMPWLSRQSDPNQLGRSPKTPKRTSSTSRPDTSISGRTGRASGDLPRSELIRHIQDIVRFELDSRTRSGADRPAQFPTEKQHAEGAEFADEAIDSESVLVSDAVALSERVFSDKQDTRKLALLAGGAGDEALSLSETTEIGAPFRNATSQAFVQVGERSLGRNGAVSTSLDMLMRAIDKLDRGDEAHQYGGAQHINARNQSGDSYAQFKAQVEAAVRSKYHDNPGADTLADPATRSESHPIDLLDDDQVDSLLFSKAELGSLFRSQAEVDLVAGLRQDWHHLPAFVPGSPSTSAAPTRSRGRQASTGVRRSKAKGLFVDQEPRPRKRNRPLRTPGGAGGLHGSQPQRATKGAVDGEQYDECSASDDGMDGSRSKGRRTVVDGDGGDEDDDDDDEAADMYGSRGDPLPSSRLQGGSSTVAGGSKIIGPIDLDDQDEACSDWDDRDSSDYD